MGWAPVAAPKLRPDPGGSTSHPKAPPTAPAGLHTAVPSSQARIEEHLWGSFLFLHRGCRRSCSDERKTDEGEAGSEENPSFSGD